MSRRKAYNPNEQIKKEVAAPTIPNHPKTKPIQLKMPIRLLERVEAYQQEHGFNSRSATIYHLIHIGLDKDVYK